PPNPAAHRLGRTADLLCDRLDRRPFRFILVRVLADQPNRPLPHLRRVLLCSCHGSNFSRVGASGKLGAIQCRRARRAPCDAGVRVSGARSCRLPPDAESLPLEHQWELQSHIDQCVTTAKSTRCHEKYHKLLTTPPPSPSRRCPPPEP